MGRFSEEIQLAEVDELRELVSQLKMDLLEKELELLEKKKLELSQFETILSLRAEILRLTK